MFLSQFFIELLGVGLMTAVNGSDAFQSAYDAAGVGGLTGEIFRGYSSSVSGFGKFIQILLSFSVIGVVVGKLQRSNNAKVVTDTQNSKHLFFRFERPSDRTGAAYSASTGMVAPGRSDLPGCSRGRTEPSLLGDGELFERHRILADTISNNYLFGTHHLEAWVCI